MIIKSKRNSRTIRAIENDLTNKIDKSFSRMLREFLSLAQMTLKADGSPLDLLIELGFAKIAEDIASAQLEVYVFSFVDTATQLKLDYSYDRINRQAISVIQERQKFVQDMKKYTKLKLLESLQKALEGDKTYQEYLKDSENIFVLDKKRARRIAINEIGSVYVEATNNTIQQAKTELGVEIVKRWTTVGDNRVTPQCNANQEVGWVPEDYLWGQDKLPPRFIGCRCTLTYDVDV